MLAQLYLESPQHLSKKPRTQRADQRCLERVIAFLGSTRDVATLSESDVRRYTLARRQGDPTLKGVTPGRPVRDRAVELDLVMLMTALNWATRERTTTGRRLLRENPLTGVRDETVQSASVRRLAAAGLQVGPDRAAAAWDVALDSAEAGDGAERIPGYPVKDVAAAGGWKTEEVLVTSYQQADAETIKNVVLRPTHRIVSR